MAEVLRTLGSERVWFVHGADGLDEITTTDVTNVVELHNGEITAFTISPDEVGIERADPAALRGGDPAHNAKALLGVLAGERNAYRDIAVLNAAAALVVCDVARNLPEGVALAQKAIDTGAARATLDRLVTVSNA